MASNDPIDTCEYLFDVILEATKDFCGNVSLTGDGNFTVKTKCGSFTAAPNGLITHLGIPLRSVPKMRDVNVWHELREQWFASLVETCRQHDAIHSDVKS